MTAVGIDDLNVYGSTLAVEARAIAAARGSPLDSAGKLGLLRRSLAPGFEDPVTLAVNAARPLIDAYGKDAFELLIVATESGVDGAKPLSSYVHHHLGLSERSFHLELKHACFGATVALNFASSWVLAHPKKRALVIATDMARKLFGDPAEPAEGAGAVAMAVTLAPRVLELEPVRGFASREVYDVMRPNPALETIHSELSLAAYLDLLELAWEGYAAAAGPTALERLEFMAFHTPVAPLVRQAHRILMETGGVPEARAAEHFERCVVPSFGYCRELGNLYSGCLYAALAGLIDTAPVKEGTVVGLYSYGSGSGASYFSGKVGSAARATVAAHRIGAHLAERAVVDVPTYERVVLQNERALTEEFFTPDPGLLPELFATAYQGRARLFLTGVRDYYRSYAWS